ncbi:MAG TPA: ribonuclease P protein component [bacterium (Candidatus Stahlbacteria)]|nr:ribonuclease P protein component [Candidatus Stahlbacteria bacterium]
MEHVMMLYFEVEMLILQKVEKGLRFSFKRVERLKNRSEFEEVFNKGKFLNGKYLTLAYIRDSKRKVGFIISKKVKGAVIRNKLKRRLREIYRMEKENLPDNVHIVIIAREQTSYELLREDLINLLKKVCV